MDVIELAKKFEISLSTLYRRMDKTNIRVFEKRGSDAWSERIILSKEMSHAK